MRAVSLRVPEGSWVLGVAPEFAWGQPSGVLGFVDRPMPAEVWSEGVGELGERRKVPFRGDVLIHQGQTVGPDLNMKFDPAVQDRFPRGQILGVARLKGCVALNGFPSKWRWTFCFPRPFAEGIPFHGDAGLFEVHSFAVQKAVERAEIVARKFWYGLEEGDREELLERAAVWEIEQGLPRASANALALAYWQESSFRRRRKEQLTVDS